MNRGAWQATIHGVAESDATELPFYFYSIQAKGCCKFTQQIFYTHVHQPEWAGHAPGNPQSLK